MSDHAQKATCDRLGTEITNASSVVQQQRGLDMPDLDVNTIQAGMVKSLLVQINNLKTVSSEDAGKLQASVASTDFTASEKTSMIRAISVKLTMGTPRNIQGKRSLQRFTNPQSSQDLLHGADWDFICDSSNSYTAKIQRIVERLSLYGMVSPDETAKCDLATLIAGTHYPDISVVSNRTLFDLGNDMKVAFASTPPRAPHLLHLELFPPVSDLPAEHRLSGQADLATPGRITEWGSIRARIASRGSSKLLRDAESARGSAPAPAAAGGDLNQMNPMAMFQMGMMLSQSGNATPDNLQALMHCMGGGGGMLPGFRMCPPQSRNKHPDGPAPPSLCDGGVGGAGSQLALTHPAIADIPASSAPAPVKAPVATTGALATALAGSQVDLMEREHMAVMAKHKAIAAEKALAEKTAAEQASADTAPGGTETAARADPCRRRLRSKSHPSAAAVAGAPPRRRGRPAVAPAAKPTAAPLGKRAAPLGKRAAPGVNMRGRKPGVVRLPRDEYNYAYNKELKNATANGLPIKAARDSARKAGKAAFDLAKAKLDE